MAVSEVTICNKALGMLGANRILSLSEDSRNATLCNENYEIVRDGILEEYPWSFAKARISLAKDLTGPDFGYANSFTLPADFLHVLEFNGDDSEYQVEGNKILSDDGTCNLIYTKKVTDVGVFSKLFIVAFSARLAAELSIPVTNSKSTLEAMMGLYEDALDRARKIDGRQGRAKKFKSGKLTKPRHAGSISVGPTV